MEPKRAVYGVKPSGRVVLAVRQGAGLSLAPAARFLMLVALAVLVLGCAAAPEPGQWQPLKASAVRMEPVVLNEKGVGRNSLGVCNEARREVEKDVAKGLPKRLEPVAFRAPGSAQASKPEAVLSVALTECLVETHQWDVGGGEPSLTFLLTLKVRVTLKEGNEVIVRHERETYEQVNSADSHIPLYEFTFRDADRFVLRMFDGGRVWIPDAATI